MIVRKDPSYLKCALIFRVWTYAYYNLSIHLWNTHIIWCSIQMWNVSRKNQDVLSDIIDLWPTSTSELHYTEKLVQFLGYICQTTYRFPGLLILWLELARLIRIVFSPARCVLVFDRVSGNTSYHTPKVYPDNQLLLGSALPIKN